MRTHLMRKENQNGKKIIEVEEEELIRGNCIGYSRNNSNGKR